MVIVDEASELLYQNLRHTWESDREGGWEGNIIKISKEGKVGKKTRDHKGEEKTANHLSHLPSVKLGGGRRGRGRCL